MPVNTRWIPGEHSSAACNNRVNKVRYQTLSKVSDVYVAVVAYIRVKYTLHMVTCMLTTYVYVHKCMSICMQIFMCLHVGLKWILLIQAYLTTSVSLSCIVINYSNVNINNMGDKQHQRQQMQKKKKQIIKKE